MLASIWDNRMWLLVSKIGNPSEKTVRGLFQGCNIRFRRKHVFSRNKQIVIKHDDITITLDIETQINAELLTRFAKSIHNKPSDEQMRAWLLISNCEFFLKATYTNITEMYYTEYVLREIKTDDLVLYHI